MTTEPFFQPTIIFQGSYVNLITLLILASFLATKTATFDFEVRSNFDHTECRSRNAWKGDKDRSSFDQSSQEDIMVKHPKNLLKIHSRRKRFISFPPGSTFTLKSELKVPKNSDERHDFCILLGFPVTLNLPEGPLSIVKDFGKENDEEEEGEENVDQKYNYIRLKRTTVDHQRKTAFDFIENVLNGFGLPGKSCVLKAVCESAEEPLDSLGMVGDLLNMFLSASFGGETEEMKEFIEAEEIGRQNASCYKVYKNCPFHLTDFLQSGLSIIHSGLIEANY